MSYLNEDGLARYDGLIKNWVTFKSGTVAGVDPLLNWQRTDAAGAVTFYPLPAAPIDPTVNFLFTETGPASGTKGPDNPSVIAGVSEMKVRRYNKNMFGAYAHAREGQTVTVNGVSFTYNQDGSILVNGQATATVQRYLTNSAVPNSMYYLRTGETYILSGFSSSESDYPRMFFRCNGNSYYFVSGLHQTQVISVTQNGYASIWIEVPSGTTVNNVLIRPQLEVGSSATSFEPSVMDVYTVNLGGTYYGGSVDLSAGTMTVTWVGGAIPIKYVSAHSNGIVVFAWHYNGDYKFPGASKTSTDITCTNFQNDVDANNTTERISLSGNNDGTAWGGVLAISESRIGGYGLTNAQYLTNAQEYLSNNSVIFAAKIWTPFIVQLTPSQIYSLSQPNPYASRINTVYSDQTSVKVGYPKSPLATSAELTNAIISLGSNL